MGRKLSRAPVAAGVLAGPDHPLHHRVHRLQVAGVGGQGHGEGFPARGPVGARGAQVVLHVPGALDGVRVHVALELGEDPGQGLAHGVGQHVQPAPVGHAHNRLPDAGPGGVREQLVQERDQGFAAFQGETLVADVLGVQEAFEGLRPHQLAQDPPAVSGPQGAPGCGRPPCAPGSTPGAGIPG